jgi:hypothetical protein
MGLANGAAAEVGSLVNGCDRCLDGSKPCLPWVRRTSSRQSDGFQSVIATSAVSSPSVALRKGVPAFLDLACYLFSNEKGCSSLAANY